jgi:hypothetical protein
VYEEETKEHMVEVAFHSATRFVPNQYYRQLHSDN